MSDILISYAREDAAKAGLLAEILTRRQWSVWWDRSIAAGKTFDDEIERELGSARAVLVLWSRHSVSSPWVRAEAGEAATRGVLVPALLEQVRVPLRFRQVQAANLETWDGAPDDPELQRLISDIARHIAHSESDTESAQGANLGSSASLADEHRRAPRSAGTAQSDAPGISVYFTALVSWIRHRRTLSVLMSCGVAVLVLLSAYYVWMIRIRPAGSNDPSTHTAAASPVSPIDIDSKEGGNATLHLRLRDVHGRSLPGTVDIMLTAMNAEGKRDDSKKPITGSRLRADASIRVINLAASSPRALQVSPEFYYPVGSFVTVQETETTAVDFTLPIFPAKVKRVSFPEYTDLPISVHRLLEASRQVQGREGQSGQRLYDSLDDVRRAMLMNVFVKLEATRLRDPGKSLDYFDAFAAIQRDRVFLYCQPTLPGALEGIEALIRMAASLHSAPDFAPRFGFKSSYRTTDHYAPMQLTFYSDGESCLAELAFDDAAGLSHVFQGLRNYSALFDSHPYTIHEILVRHQKIDPRYQLEP